MKVPPSELYSKAKTNCSPGELQKQQKQRVRELEDAGAKIESITIEGKDVVFASTPDHRLRSFYVRHENYHLVTNCREIARRFVECSRGERSLADSEDFRYAREISPVAQDNTIFVYLSREFFEGLLSPRYQIELHRRLQSVTDATLIELAVLAAVAEGFGDHPVTMNRLVELGFLPSRVDQRADDSVTRIHGTRAIDSMRGAIGTFLPIPDVPIRGVTPSELGRFQKTREFYLRRWDQMHPVLVELDRTALDERTERVEVEARMLPLNAEQSGFLMRLFGPPNRVQIRPPKSDILSVQAYLGNPETPIPPHHLYFGIRDEAPRHPYSQRRLLKSLQVLRTAPAYLAAWPRPELLDQLGFVGRPAGNGYRRMLLGLYRLNTSHGFSLLSFDQRILAEVADELEPETTDDTAQLRVEVGDVKHSRFGSWANDLDFQRAWETSVGNVHLLHVVHQQFRVPLKRCPGRRRAGP